MRLPATSKRVLSRFGPLVPAVLLMTALFLTPVLYSLYLAFTDKALTGAAASGPEHFVGVANFDQMVHDPFFWNSVGVTLIFLIGSAIVGQNTLGLLIALLMQGRSQAVRSLVGLIVIGAWVVPEVVAGYMWFAFLSQDGTLNAMLGAVGFHGRAWLFATPLFAISIANVWRGTAFSMLMYSAALTEVPADVLDAAAVDGAGTLQRLRHITVPMIRRTIATNLVLITLATLSLFGLVYAMTRGGPGRSTEIVPIYMYEQSFKFFNLAYGSAISTVLLLIGAVASIGYVRLLRERA